MTALYTQHMQSIFAANLSAGAYASEMVAVAPALKRLQHGENSLANPLLALPEMALDETIAHAKRLSDFRHIVVIGSGGSSLSGLALCRLKIPIHSAGIPRMHFLETIDPFGIERLLSRIELPETAFIIVSKSGSTIETMAQSLVLLQKLRDRCGDEAISRQFSLITMHADNPLKRLGEHHNMPIIDHAPDVGGRFSIFSIVGLLPAMLAGLDVKALLAGASQVVIQMRNATTPANCPPAMGAALQVAAMKAGLPINVLFSYNEQLKGLNAWWRQCWAESLGKEGMGSTPFTAIGSTDQHSQLQLFLGGPRDKFFTMLLRESTHKGDAIEDSDIALMGTPYLRHRSTGDILAAQQEATLQTLIKGGCPLRVLRIEHVDEQRIGALLMHFMIEILLVAELLGINAFNQPSVEEGKRLTLAALEKMTD